MNWVTRVYQWHLRFNNCYVNCHIFKTKLYLLISRYAEYALKSLRTTPPTGNMRPQDVSTTIECQGVLFAWLHV